MTDNWNPRDLAAPLSNEALADLIHELSDILAARLNAAPRDEGGSWLKRQVDNARIEARSWPSSRQRMIKESL